jgi:predicted aldo/keto reductase-like oxidoreductase
MKRRDFLKTSALMTASLVTSPLKARAAATRPTVQRYTEIGKTGLKMSDISFGTGKLPSPSMVLRAIDRGINYFDTAPDYGPAERYIGRAMSDIRRDKIIIASKFCSPEPYPGHLPLGSKRKDYIASVEGRLAIMTTDYLDICFVHAIGEKRGKKTREEEKKRLLDEEMLSAYDALKKAGKVRFLAVSSHGPNNMEEHLLAAVMSGHFDIIMPAFNFMQFPELPYVLKVARNKGVGVIAMKTLAGAKEMNLDVKGEPFETAAFKWVLKHVEVNGLIVTMKTVENLDLYLKASGKKFSAADKPVLDRYARVFTKEYCRTGCGTCEGACPGGVEIATTLRLKMYFTDYGMEKRALESYALLTDNAGRCLSCENDACRAACPHGLPVRELLTEAHETLSFKV